MPEAKHLLLSVYLLLFLSNGYSQLDSIKGRLHLDSASTLCNADLSLLKQISTINLSKEGFDSVLKRSLPNFPSLPNKDSIITKSLPAIGLQKTKKLLAFNGGYVSYNWSFRSNIDTPFLERDISQHFLTVSASFTIADKLPIQVSYFGRNSNSLLFRDYHDYRVELNRPAFQKLHSQRLNSELSSAVARLRNPLLKPSLTVSNERIEQLDQWLNCKDVLNKYYSSIDQLRERDFLDSLHFDTSSLSSPQFLKVYNSVKAQKERYTEQRDSLLKVYIENEKKVQKLERLLKGGVSQEVAESIIDSLSKDSTIQVSRFNRLLKTVYAIRTFSIGKSLPNHSDLTVKNIGIKGINFEYNYNNLYFALTGGALDFRGRDFLYQRQRRIPGYMYTTRVGYGVKEGSNIILSYYRGKKQLFSSSTYGKATEIYGVSIASQLKLGKHTVLGGELAQSAAPKIVTTNASGEKGSLQISDRSSSAWLLKFRSSLPKLGTRLEGFYQNMGAEFQNFTSYKVNAATERWSAKVEQYLFKRSLQLVGSAQKNTFENPFIEQRYKANTVFKTFAATYRKRGLPSLSLSYMPSSQYTLVDAELFQTNYQMFNAVLQHQYRWGAASGVSSLIYNQFFNESTDSGFVFFNSKNYYLNQLFYFPRFWTNLSVSHAYNNAYTINVIDAGVNIKVIKDQQLGGGVKINHLNNEEVRVGFYCNINYQLKKVGALQARAEKSYLPSLGETLRRSDFYSVGFTRTIL